MRMQDGELLLLSGQPAFLLYCCCSVKPQPGCGRMVRKKRAGFRAGRNAYSLLLCWCWTRRFPATQAGRGRLCWGPRCCCARCPALALPPLPWAWAQHQHQSAVSCLGVVVRIWPPSLIHVIHRVGWPSDAVQAMRGPASLCEYPTLSEAAQP